MSAGIGAYNFRRSAWVKVCKASEDFGRLILKYSLTGVDLGGQGASTPSKILLICHISKNFHVVYSSSS